MALNKIFLLTYILQSLHWQTRAMQRLSTCQYSVSHHMVIKPLLLLGLSAEYRSRRWVWSTVVRRPSEVYDTHRRTKLTAPEMISCSTDMVGYHQNINGLRDWTMPFSGIILPSMGLATINLPTKFKVSNCSQYEDMKGDTNCRKWGGLG